MPSLLACLQGDASARRPQGSKQKRKVRKVKGSGGARKKSRREVRRGPPDARHVPESAQSSSSSLLSSLSWDAPANLRHRISSPSDHVPQRVMPSLDGDAYDDFGNLVAATAQQHQQQQQQLQQQQQQQQPQQHQPQQLQQHDVTVRSKIVEGRAAAEETLRLDEESLPLSDDVSAKRRSAKHASHTTSEPRTEEDQRKQQPKLKQKKEKQSNHKKDSHAEHRRKQGKVNSEGDVSYASSTSKSSSAISVGQRQHDLPFAPRIVHKRIRIFDSRSTGLRQSSSKPQRHGHS